MRPGPAPHWRSTPPARDIVPSTSWGLSLLCRERRWGSWGAFPDCPQCLHLGGAQRLLRTVLLTEPGGLAAVLGSPRPSSSFVGDLGELGGSGEEGVHAGGRGGMHRRMCSP